MKNKEFLQDSIGLIDEEFIREAKDEPKKKGLPWAKIVSIAACVAIIAAIPVGVLIAKMQMPPSETIGLPNTEADTTPQFDEDGREIWADNRKYKDGVDVGGEELAYGWKWEYLDIYEKYWIIDAHGEDESYYFINSQIPEELLGEYLGEMVAYGYEEFGENAGKRHEIGCVAYSIKGAPDNDAIAIKIDGTNEFVTYLIIRRNYEHPETLGELISMKNLSETLKITSFSYDHDNDSWTSPVKYELTEAQNDHIWKILVDKCWNAESFDYDNYYGSYEIGFNVTSIPLGLPSKSISIYSDGFIRTNIMEYGDCFCIGKSVANEIIEYVLTEPKEAPESTSKYVAGTITEIGEDYFKINDAPMMENEGDGIEFTVNTTDIKILRYFKSGVLKVGDTAIVKYDGNIYADEPTTINGAYSIDECWIVDGEAFIPE